MITIPFHSTPANEFLLDFPGCILIVSHDRYFMDRMVDHLFAFEGDAVIRDYPGNYSQYREALANGSLTDERQLMQAPKPEPMPKEAAFPPLSGEARRGLSFKEKRELELLEKEMPELQQEKATLETNMGVGNLGFEALQKNAERVSAIIEQLDNKEMRWLELSERV